MEITAKMVKQLRERTGAVVSLEVSDRGLSVLPLALGILLSSAAFADEPAAKASGGDWETLFDGADETAEAKADARAEADVAANRLISHAAVKSWLKSWGRADRAPRPRAGK